MTLNNKLKIAILAILSSQHLYAITLDPLQIQSAPGELLYAEMSFHQANSSDKLDVSLATPEDVMMLGAVHQPPASLNFYTRRNGQGEGTIVITSNRPMTDAELNIILKIQEGNATHLKHIKQSIRQGAKTATLAKTSNEKSLAPKFIVSEKDIALNLPESTRFSASPIISNNKSANQGQERLLNVSSAAPPALNTSVSPPVASTAISVAATPTTKVESAPVSIQNSAPVLTQSPTPVITQTNNTSITTQSKILPVPVSATPIQSPPVTPVPKQTIPAIPNVQPNNIAATSIENIPAPVTAVKPLAPNPAPAPKPINEEQAQVKAPQPPVKKTPLSSPIPAITNSKVQSYTVQRNESLWSISQRIAGQTRQPVNQVMNQIKAQNQHAFIGGNANRLRQGSQLNLSLNPATSRPDQNINQLAAQTTRPASGKAKYRLQQAEMSLVAESQQDSSTGSAKKDTLQQKTNADLSLKVMTAREKTVTLQRNVTQLELALSQKEQRIHLLNARLAELQDQLKAQQETKKPSH